MGYFPNGTSGMSYEDAVCRDCVHFGPEEGPGCPVWGLHLLFNYDADKSGDARGKDLHYVLNSLIPRTEDGLDNKTCRMFHRDTRDRRTLPLFDDLPADVVGGEG